MIIANPRDELVSLSGLSEWIEENGLAPAWKVQATRPVRRDPFMPEHLMVDEGSFGKREWHTFQTLTEDFLR
jgi:hypothetical protein